jgi:hypothetical protein
LVPKKRVSDCTNSGSSEIVVSVFIQNI